MSVELIASAVIDRARQVRGKWEISSHVTQPQGARYGNTAERLTTNDRQPQ